jgi:hypothetical protein
MLFGNVAACHRAECVLCAVQNGTGECVLCAVHSTQHIFDLNEYMYFNVNFKRFQV